MNKRLGVIAAVSALVVCAVFLVFGIYRYIYTNKAKQIYLAANALVGQKDYVSAAAAYEKVLSNFPKSGFALKARFGLAEAYTAANKLIEARDVYRDILSANIDMYIAKQVYDKMGDLNIRILFSPVKTPDSMIYKVRDNDTLQSVADRHHTTVALIKKANNITSEVIRLGRELKISTANFSIVVDKSQNTLTLKSEEEVVKIYPVSTGKDNITPVGTFKILSKIINPPWFSGGKVILPGDPKNILGSRWMGLTAKSYGIHGTTDDASIGSQCTQGCVRMHNKDVEELYDIVPIGTEVTIVD